jgi:hypothetical protein
MIGTIRSDANPAFDEALQGVASECAEPAREARSEPMVVVDQTVRPDSRLCEGDRDGRRYAERETHHSLVVAEPAAADRVIPSTQYFTNGGAISARYTGNIR